MITGRIRLTRIEHRHLAVEANRRAGDQGLVELDAGAIDGVARGEVVAAIEDDIGPRHFLFQPGAGKTFVERNHMAFGVDLAQRALARRSLCHANGIGAMQDLALQVGQVDRVAIGQYQGANARRGQVIGRGRTQAAGTDDQRAGIDDVVLALDADLRQQDVATVAQQLVVGHRYLSCLSSGGVSSWSPCGWCSQALE